MKLFQLSALLFLLCLSTVMLAATRYVSQGSITPTAPYTSWETAAHDIQSAIDQSSDGDLIMVGDGTYQITSTIRVTKGITIQSINGPSASIIDGNNAILCIYMDNTNAVIDGFTVTKGYNPYDFGGGVHIVSGGTVKNCIISNSQARDGGGVAIDNSGLVQNCIIKGNKADNNSNDGYGGGIRLFSGGIVRGCLVYGNTSVNMGGGINIWDAGTIQNCTVTNNTAPNGAGVRLRGVSVMENTISYLNNGTNWVTEGSSYTLSNNCTTPALPSGSGNITDAPSFVNPGAENYNLSSGSLCINAGLNQTWMTGAKDLNGNDRIINGTVDIGAYEFVPSYLITVSAGAGGTISPGTNTTINYGASQTFTITANTGYHIQDVLVDGQSVGAVGTYTFTNVTVNHTISASFSNQAQTVYPVPVISYPKGGIIVYMLSPTLCWYFLQATTGIQYLELQYSTVIDFSSNTVTISNIAPGVVSYKISGLKAGTIYYWRIRAKGTDGFSDYSATESFQTDQSLGAVTPVPTWPIGGATVYTNTPTLYWYAVTSSTGLTFKVKYSTDPNNTNANGDLSIIEAGNALSITLPALTWGKTYYWQVMSTDGAVNSNYSVIASFKVTGESVVSNPQVPIAAWPIDGATVYTSTQTLSWYLLTGGANIVSYTVKWGENGNLNNIIPGITNNIVQITGLLPGHTYSWQVESVDKFGNHSAPSTIEQFVTSGGTGNKPYTPVQYWPIGGATVYTTSPTLTWYFVQASFGITGFKVKYSKYPDMSSANEVSVSGTVYLIQLQNLEKGTTYYWQVQSYDGHVYSDPQLPPASFIVYSDIYVYTPMAMSPVGGIGLNTGTVEMSWASGDNNEAMSYNLQYSTNPEFKGAIEKKNINQSSFKAENLSNSTYYWRVQSKTQDGILSEYSPVGKFTVNGVTGIADEKLMPEGFSLLQNYPNPFNPTTSIMFNLSNESHVIIEVYNSIGRSVGRIFEGNKPKGLSSITFNAENLPSGIYFYKITAADLNGNTNYDIKKMMLLK